MVITNAYRGMVTTGVVAPLPKYQIKSVAEAMSEGYRALIHVKSDVLEAVADNYVKMHGDDNFDEPWQQKYAIEPFGRGGGNRLIAVLVANTYKRVDWDMGDKVFLKKYDVFNFLQ